MNRALVFLPFLVPLFAQEPAGALEHARIVNLDRADKLPNFTADEMAMRYKSRHSDPPNWQLVDTVEAEIVVQGEGFNRQHTRLNGKPWSKPSFPNFTWSPSFGYELKALFDPKCPTIIEFEGHEQARGRSVVAYRFHSPPNGCFGTYSVHNGMFSATKTYNPARTGRFLIEDPGGNVIQFEMEAHEFPKGFAADTFKQTTSWDYVKIGDAIHLLPVAFEIFAGFSKSDLWCATGDYKNHRHYEASTNITFQPEEVPPR